MKLGIVIGEDYPNFRAGLEALFSEESGFFVAASFPSAVAFMHSAEEIVERGADHWDLVLMDIEMPGMSGIEATSRLKRLMPQVPVVVVTVFEEPATILDAICAGADGYLLEKTPVPELLAQLRSIASGGSPLTPGVARSLLDLVRGGAEKPHRRHSAPTRLDLSEREQEVLRCLTRGLSYKQVADELGVSWPKRISSTSISIGCRISSMCRWRRMSAWRSRTSTRRSPSGPPANRPLPSVT